MPKGNSNLMPRLEMRQSQTRHFKKLRFPRFKLKKLDYTGGQVKRYSSPFSRCFSLKTAFLKWIFEADPVGVQIRAVSHFNGLEEIFKMR